jgi:hypothetical protein
MRVTDISKIPAVGDTMAVPNESTWDLEKLLVVAIQEDPTTARMMHVDRVAHVYFQSPEVQDNVNILPNGIQYYTIRTYAG